MKRQCCACCRSKVVRSCSKLSSTVETLPFLYTSMLWKSWWLGILCAIAGNCSRDVILFLNCQPEEDLARVCLESTTRSLALEPADSAGPELLVEGSARWDVTRTPGRIQKNSLDQIWRKGSLKACVYCKRKNQAAITCGLDCTLFIQLNHGKQLGRVFSETF